MITHSEHEYDDVDERESMSTNVLKEIEQTDSDAELMKIAKREWLMGNTLLAIKSAYKAAMQGNAKAQTFLGEAPVAIITDFASISPLEVVICLISPSKSISLMEYEENLAPNFFACLYIFWARSKPLILSIPG